MELECDLSTIHNEELLRKMWQQSEDVNRKKEIRSQLYKLRESRLKDLYQGDIMADRTVAGFGKDPLVTSHGDGLADQSFQSLKSKEIRDSLSPTEIKFQSMALNNPNTTGWNVQSSKEVSPDGRGFRAETVATTDGVENINGGIAEFKGRNEERSSAHHEGDDKNFVKKAMESSNSHLQEKVVIGDENSGLTEVRTSSTKSTSSSQVIQSSINVEYDDGFPISQQPHHQKYLTDSNFINQQDLQQHQQQEQQRLLEEQRIYEQEFQQRQQHLNQQERRSAEHVSTTRQTTQQKNVSQNIQTQETNEKNKRYVDMDKASPEYQQHVQYLMQQPGEIISSTVEYPKPNVKMITTVKRLPDGTIVRNKRYETEESAPSAPSGRQTSNVPNQTTNRRDSQQQSRNYQPDSTSHHSRPSQDMVDKGNTSRYVQDVHADDMETKYSSIKKSSKKFSSETTSETIQEVDENHPQGGPSSRPKSKTNDFSTHGFPSVRADKPTQEYPTERPHAAYPAKSYPSQTGPVKPTEAVVPHYTDDSGNIIERRVNTKDGEVIIVSSQKQRNFKTSTNSERIVETEHIAHDDHPHQQIPSKTPQDFSTHGFPSVRQPSSHQPKNHSSEKQMQPNEQDFPLDKYPPGTRIMSGSHLPPGDNEVIVVSSQKSHTAKHSTNTERIIEHEIKTDSQQHDYPSAQPSRDNATPYNYTVTTPGDHTPHGEFPGSPKKPYNTDFSTQGYPSVRTPGYVAPGEYERYNDGSSKHPDDEYSTKGYPSVKVPTRPAAGLPSSHNQYPSSPRKSPGQDYSTQGFPSVRSPSKGTPTQGYPSNVEVGKPNGPTLLTNKTPSRTQSPNKYKAPNTTVRETTERVIRKEKEVDSAHRAFAASLRSSSPIDHIRRDSYTTDSHSRHTPRSSVSSTKAFRRDMREGSHDSAPSETSRISTTTITRNTPPRTVGGRTVVTKVVNTKTGPGSTDRLNLTSPRSTKSPSPGKTVTTTTTTTRILTSKDVPKVTDNQHTRITTTNKIDTLFPINEPQLTSITKNKLSDNHKQPHKKPKSNIRKKNMPVKTDSTASAFASASAKLEEVIEAPFLKKHYYKLGPSDQTQAQVNTTRTTSQPIKSSQTYEKSPTKKQSSQPQPAPSSRSSTPSYNNRKPQASVMADDYDDDNLSTSPFSPPSYRSRTPQKVAPNDNDNTRDDWQTPRRPDNDERRTVNREPIFEKTEIAPPTLPRKPNFEQPSVEWVIVDDVDVDVDVYEHNDGDDHYDDDDNNRFASEVVDAKFNVKKTTTKLITQEKQAPGAPQRKTKPSTTTTTVTTKQFHTTPSKSQTKPNDKSPLKTKPNNSRTPQQNKANKPLTTDSSSPLHNPSRSQQKPFTRGPKTSVPSYTSPLRKSSPKTINEETALRKTTKTSQTLKDKTTKLIEPEKPKHKPQSPNGKTKPQTSDRVRPNELEKEETIVVTETTRTRLADRKIPHVDYETITPNQGTPYENVDEPIWNIPNNKQPQIIDDTRNIQQFEVSLDYKNPQKPQQGSPGYLRPHDKGNEPNHFIPEDINNRPRHKSPALRKPPSPGFQKLQSTFDERSPQFGKQIIADDEDTEDILIIDQAEKQQIVEGHISFSKTSEKIYPGRAAPKHPDQEPKQETPGFPGYRMPEDADKPYQGSPGYRKPQNTDFEPNQNLLITETSQKRVPRKDAPKRRSPSPENKQGKESPHKHTSRTLYFNHPNETDEELSNIKPELEPLETDDDEEYITQSERLVATSQKKVAKHIQKFETKFSDNKSSKPQKKINEPSKQIQEFPNKPVYTGYKSPERNQKIPKEPIHTGSKSLERVISPTRNQKVPGQKFPKEPIHTGPKSPERAVSPTRNQKKPQEPVKKRPQSPNKIPIQPTDERTKSPNKHVSPQRTQMITNEKVSFDDEIFTTSLKTTKPVNEKLIKEIDGQGYPKHIPKDLKPTAGKPFETIDDRTFTKADEFATSSTQKRIVSETEIFECEELLHPQQKPVREDFPTRTPNRFEELPRNRAQSPNKHSSPTRTQKKQDQRTIPNNDQTFRKTLHTTETVTKVGDNHYPQEEIPFGIRDRPRDHITYPDRRTEAEQDEEIIETSEFVINTTQNQIVTEHTIQKLDEPTYPNFTRPQRNNMSPIKPVSPTRNQKTPTEKLPQDKFNAPAERRPPSPNKHLSPTRTPKKPSEVTASKNNETFSTSITNKEIVNEHITQGVDYNEYQQIKKTSKTEEDNKPKSPTRERIGKRPQSPNKPLSPTRNHSQPIRDDETFKASLRTTKSVTDKTTKEVYDEQHPDNRAPHNISTKLMVRPKERKPHYDEPSDDEEHETFTETSEHVVSSKTCKVTGKLVQEPESPVREFSPTRIQKVPEEHGKRPRSPIKGQKEPTSKDNIFKSTIKTTSTVTGETCKNEDNKREHTEHTGPHQIVDKHEAKPKHRENYMHIPLDNEENEALLATSDRLITSKTHMVNEKLIQEFEEPQMPIKDVSPTRAPKQKLPQEPKTTQSPTQIEKKPDQTMVDDNETFTKSSKIVTRTTTQHSLPNTQTDGDKTFIETTQFVFKSSNKPEYPGSQKPNKKLQHTKPDFEETDDNEIFVNTTEFIRNTSQKLIETEQQTLETEKELYCIGSKDLPRKEQSPTPKGQKNSQLSKTTTSKISTANDETFKKSLRATDNVSITKVDERPILIKHTDTDEEDTTTETEDLLIETCEKNYVTENNFISEEESRKVSAFLMEPNEKKPGERKPDEPYTYVETSETIVDQTYPEDGELLLDTAKYQKNKTPIEVSQEPWLPKQTPKCTININEEFIETERVRKETPDGAFISKTTETSTSTSPTFKKKGAGRSDTFEERCRQILGMDSYGDTPGSYKKQPNTEVEQKKTIVTEEVKMMPEGELNTNSIFQVKIEDCDEDDEPFSINSVKKTLHKQVNVSEHKHNETLKENSQKSKTDKPEKTPIKPLSKGHNETFEHEKDHIKRDHKNEYIENITEITTPQKKLPKNKSIDVTEPDSSGPETVEETYVKETKKTEVKITKKTSPTSSPRSSSPTKSTSSPRSVSPTKGNIRPTKDTSQRQPSRDKKSPQKLSDDTTTIKDRLRSSMRKTNSSLTKSDQVEGSESSPEHSPTRYTERRRSSNISVTTEIIIEHTDSDTPAKKPQQDSIFREIIDSTVMPEKLTRRMPVTERKESAPVHRVTNKDKDSKMSRSTSENLIKIKNTEPHFSSQKTPTKITDHRRPNKCFATKSINLSATDRLVKSGDMENVVIDIQHAKSSREPSPDKIVPTPVPAHLDTGKPRYPDVVQEPEDDQPKRNPQIKNIPIFEEESNSFVGCHITEINVERSHKTNRDSLDYEEHILKNPVVEAPLSLDYISLDKPSDDDESLLTVHEKVNKFQNITEEIKKPGPINKTVGKSEKARGDIGEDTEFTNTEHIYSTITLAPTAPQISPELVRTISKHISKQNEIDFNSEVNEDYPLTSHNDDHVECLANNKKSTKEFKVSHHETTTETTSAKTAEKYQQPQQYDDNDDDELIPHTATHTTIIEERRQKDILNRPSVFDSRNKKPTVTATTITKAPLKCNKSPVKDSEKLRPDIKSRTTKPTSAVTHTPTEQNIATTTKISTTSNTQPKQSPKRKNSDIDYELRGNNVETGVSNIISKQTKVYSSSSNSSSGNKTNDLKKPITTSNKKPEKHMAVRLTPAKNTDEHDLSADDEMMIVTTFEEATTTNIDIESQVVNEETNTKIPSTSTATTPHKKEQTITTAAHSSTSSSPTDQPLKTKTKEHLVKLTEKKPFKSNTVTTTTTTTSIKTHQADDIDKTVLEPSTKKSPTKITKMSSTTTDSVAARRSLFENNNSSPSPSPSSTTPTKRTPLTSPMSGRRPSYMDHTKSSLEHTRRDSLEINKTNYSRKPFQPEDDTAAADRNSMVKFEVPHDKRAPPPRTVSVTEDINVEEIFELEELEKLLETVQSYEIRRRIRAQIRLIRKNQRNELMNNSTNSELTTKTVKTYKEDSEEPDTYTTASIGGKPKTTDKSSSQTTETKEAASHKSSSKKEYIFEEAYHPTTRRSPKPNRYPHEEETERVLKPTRCQSPQQSPVCRRNAEHERRHSPDHHQHTEVVRDHGSRTTKQQYYYKDEQEHEEVHEVRHESSPTRKSSLSPSRKPSHSMHSSPERVHVSPEPRSPLKKERSHSPQTKTTQSNRATFSRSPDTKTSASTIRKSSASYEQQETMKGSTSKPQTKRITTTTTTKSKPEDKAPVWADRKNILKTPGSTTPKKPSSSTSDSRSVYTKTSKSTSSHKTTSNKSSSFIDDDCVTSSYGIGPTDENGLPLFGIRALKKKRPTVEPSETTEEVTGYVVEEKYYSDNRTKPTLERKEFIYSTNPEELQKLKEQVEVTTNRKALTDVDLKESKRAALISKATPALRSSPEDDFLDSTTKYVRRGSVKEMSEKFIQKEASSTLTEKSNNYPKAGLILRTNSRKSSRDLDNESENVESYKTIRVQQHHTNTVLADSDDNQLDEYEVEEVGSRHSGRFITESESECDSIKTQREFKKIISSSSSSMATRSFLNSQGEEKVVTNVSDCLERMRNADNVVEEGDTAEDQEARALLNKFLGASIIMKGVESSIPATNRQSKIITTTTTSCNLSDDNDGDNNAAHEVKTTRITKTINSGSSSTPVTYTTCDIEEIWDEDILKELLEQARTYEERRKIRSRLRELMADREERKKSHKGNEKEATAAAVAANVSEEEEEGSSASEYEEIIEEVTDYSEAESEVIVSEKSPGKDKASQIVVARTEEKSVAVTAKPEKNSAKQADPTGQVEETKTVIKTQIVEEVIEECDDKADSCAKGESLKPMVHDNSQKTLQTMLQENSAHSSQSTNSQKLKSAQTSSNNKIKTAVSESSSMHAPYNSTNYKTQRATSAAPTSNQNTVVTERTAGRADSTSINNKSYKNNNNANVYNSNDSSSGSLGDNSVVVGSSDSPRQVDRLGVPQKEDSGTESGEDLRLIAAGLRDQLQIQSDSNIIEDVTCALSRLENSLKEGKDISVDTEKRKALLALVARLRAGLTSPEKLAEIAAAMSELDGNEGLCSETSSPEADAHRSNRNRFGKRKNRVSRHTVGVSREELADARRYMEDMLLMSNISQRTTPEANSNNTPSQWYPLEKNASTGTILIQPATPVFQRPKQFVHEQNASNTFTNRLITNSGKRRPLSGEFSVSFEDPEPEESSQVGKQEIPDDNSKSSRFANKKHLMKRANTIDLAKTHKYNPELDTDSDAEDKGTNFGLKRAVQVSVKKRVQNVVPPFEPKTENDRKFLAFINKQSDKPGLGWTTSRSVSNWTNKFGSIKSTFEGGLAGKPPLAPYHVSGNTKHQQSSKLYIQPVLNNKNPPQTFGFMTNQQIASRLQREAERQVDERKRKLEKEHERRERDKLERQRQQRERQDRERLEREHFERQRREQDQLTAAQHAAILREQEQLVAARQTTSHMNAPQPTPINEFKHAPQSVFRPIENGGTPSKPIYKPIPQHARNPNNWQPFNALPARNQMKTLSAPSFGACGNTRPDDSFITSPPPSSRSPIALPWASKPTVDSSSFKSKAHKFEERSKYDNIHNTAPLVQRHNSLRSSNVTSNQLTDEFRKRPSLPNAFDPYSIRQKIGLPHDPLAYLPPPQNISFTYNNPKTTHQSYPCLPLAVANNSRENEYQRHREDSLTDPHSVPLVLTSSNPLYCPASQASTKPQQQQPNQSRLHRQFELVSPANSTPTSPSIYTMQQTDCTDDELDSDNNLLEYHAVSRVMGKPKSQTAVTVGRRTGHVSDDELYGKNSRAAKNLLSTMKSIGNSNGMTRTKAPVVKRPEAVTSPRTCLSPDGRSYQAPIVEPLFPEINKFEPNRKPLYIDESKKHTPTTSTYSQPAPRGQTGMYKSMENLNRYTAKSQANVTQQPSPKPYVSETQTSYVVTYPIDDTTDDEDYSRLGKKKMMPPNTLDFKRHRNSSENSTGSSTTASMSFSQNLPSPNTNWTSNPIVVEESMNKPYQNTNVTISPSPAEPSCQVLSGQTKTNYSSVQQNHNPPSSDPTKMLSDYEEPSQRHTKYNGSTVQRPAVEAHATANSQTQLQRNKTNKKETPQKTPEIHPTAIDYTKQVTAKSTTPSAAMQENKTMASLHKPEERQSLRRLNETVINPKNSNISSEMLMRLDQQRERISNEMRRKSLGNNLDYQIVNEVRYEAQNTQVYKSSAPSDTPDIVKSSLPKDETQPILKKFGPPQRHHYMPNSYQSPSIKTTSSAAVTTPTHSTTTKQTVAKTSTQILRNSRPTVVETPATPRPDDDYIPRNIVYNNIHAFTSMSRRQESETSSTNLDQHHTIRPSKLSKSDSWNQIMMLQSQHIPTNHHHTHTKFNQSPTSELRRTKSGHTLALPKMFEAAITKNDISEKQKTVAAYFSGQKSPTHQQETTVEQTQQTTTKRSVINRIKTSDKVSAACRKSLGSNLPIAPGPLQRSATMPHIANLNLLDESNVEDAFEQLIMEQKQQKSSSSTTEKTETKEKDGAVVTTTTKVTTRTVTGSAAAPVSPFAKFKQLDGQNLQQSAKSPTTTTATAGGSTASPLSGNQPIFKFTDPALNAKAATVKEQLLQWCQSKTQEYENIEITNFSTSWNNGLAFCALIHHFLPDAFDYSQLTPKNRRKNFELAFTVADEKAGIAPLLDVEDMVVMQRPDWKCVFVYVQSIYRRFRNCQ